MTMTTVESRAGFFSSRAMNVLLATVLAAAAGVGGAALVTSGALKGVLGTPAAVTAPAMEVPPAPPPHPVLPRMQLQAQYAGPLQDTVVQRLRDPVDGTVCYVYLPIAVRHMPASRETGYIDYGANNIGSIACYQPATVMRTTAPPARPVRTAP